MVSIILVEDHNIVRQGLRSLLEKEPNFSVLAEAANGLDALDLVERHQPDILVLDLMLPGLNGLEVTRQVSQRFPTIGIIILSMHSDESYVIKALNNGARGYVLKESSAQELTQAIWAVCNSGRYLSPPFSDRAIATYVENMQEAALDPYEELTTREREVLQLVAEGKTSANIADLLVISPRTVEVHRANMMRKLNLHSQTELIMYAMKRKLIPPGVESVS